MSDTPSALSGITVVDLSDGLAAALASMFLADNGARVIRLISDDANIVREPDIFALYDRGKEVARLDAEDVAGCLREMCAGSDVLLDDLPASSPMREMLGFDTLVNRNPRLVHCSITGYGPKGR